MRVWRLVVTTATFVALICPRAGAQTLAPHDVYEKRKSSVVFFRKQATAEDMGFGVLISKEGHVLTAKHVIDGYGEKEPVRATIGSKATNPLLEFEQDVRNLPELDVSVLKIKNLSADPHPAPIGKADHFREGSTQVEILTGFIDQKTSTPLSATVSGNLDSKPDLWRMQGAGIDAGHSGSPAFDQYGNVVGFVPDGFAGKGVFDLRTFDNIGVWLKQMKIPIEERVRPNKFVAYVRAIGQHEEVRANLQQKVTEIIEKWLGVKRSQIDADPPFLRDVMTRWEDPADDALELVVNKFGASWLAAHDAQILYLYFVNLDFAGDNYFPTSAKQLLVALEYDGKIYKAKQMKLNPATFQKPRADGGSATDRKALLEGALSLLRAAAETPEAPFRENGFIFAECLGTVNVPDALANQISQWKAEAAQRLTSELHKAWINHPVNHHYRLASSGPSKCGGLFQMREDAEQQYRQQSEMAELVIESLVSGVGQRDEVTIDWQLRRARPNAEAPGPRLRVNLGGDNFATGLASSIEESWDTLLTKLKSQ